MIILNDNSEKREENNDDRGDQSIERSIEELSDLADKLTKEANILVEIEEFDEALDKYDEAIELYKQTNNDSEIEKIFELIEKCYDDKSKFLRKAIMKESKEKVKSDIEKYEAEQVVDLKEQDRIQKLMELEREKEEEEIFKVKILKMASEAEKMEREYDIAIKKGKFDLEPPFEKIIHIYEDLLKILRDKGWIDQLSVYKNQIKLLREKIVQDKKLREIEVRKKERDKEFLDSLKIKKTEEVNIEKTRIVEEKLKRGAEDEIFQQQIDLKVTDAEKMIKTYDRFLTVFSFRTFNRNSIFVLTS